MALSKGTTVGTPRIFVSFIQWARAIGLPISYSQQGLNFGNDNPSLSPLFDMNPVKTTSFATFDSTETTYAINVGINNQALGGDGNSVIQRILATTNYFAVLGLETTNTCTFILQGLDSTGAVSSTDAVRSAYAPIDAAYGNGGYLIDTMDGSFEGINGNQGYAIGLNTDPNTLVSIGSFDIGRHFTFDHGADLNVTVDYDYSGISKQRTLGGSDVVNVQYYKQPNWGNFAPWTTNPAFNYASRTGRRVWKMKFSYMDHENMFPGNMNEDFMVNQDIGDDNELLSEWSENTDNFVSNFITMTMGGQIPFIFQPDKTKDQFALCRLNQSGFSLNQVSTNVWDVTMNFVETW